VSIAEHTCHAATLEEARSKASKAFNQYFGGRPWKVVRESATPSVERGDGEVSLWGVEVRAEVVD
jgi:hypothetical protein